MTDTAEVLSKNFSSFWNSQTWQTENALRETQEDTEALTYLRTKFPDVDENVFHTNYLGTVLKNIVEANAVCEASKIEKVCAECQGGLCDLPKAFKNGRSRPVITIKDSPRGYKFLDIRWSCAVDCKYQPLSGEAERLIKGSGLLPNQLNMTFANYKHCGNSELQVAKGQALMAVSEQSSLILSGKPGTGKTHLAVAIALKVIESGNQAIFGLVSELMDKLRESNRDGTYSELMEKFKKVPCLVLDDLGKERTTAAGIEYLYQIIDSRYRHKLQTIVTTNAKNSAELSLWGSPEYMEPIVSRIIENGAWVTIANAADFRTKISESRMKNNVCK